MKAYDKVCGKKLIRKYRRDALWWNEEVQNAILKKKIFKTICNHRSKENKTYTIPSAIKQRKWQEQLKQKQRKKLRLFLKVLTKFVKRKRCQKQKMQDVNGKLDTNNIDRKKNIETAHRRRK